jgi:hypothetical protein
LKDVVVENHTPSSTANAISDDIFENIIQNDTLIEDTYDYTYNGGTTPVTGADGGETPVGDDGDTPVPVKTFHFNGNIYLKAIDSHLLYHHINHNLIGKFDPISYTASFY